jgi:uncharacterized protein
MKIVVVSDSHGRNELLKMIQEKNSDASLFIHCGDLEGDPLNYPGYIMVRGNNDYWGEFEDERIIPIANHKIYVTHSHRFSYFQRGLQMANRAHELGCDIVCYGHTHVAMCDEVDGVLELNPGSLAHSRDGREVSYAILYIEDDEVSVEFKFKSEW